MLDINKNKIDIFCDTCGMTLYEQLPFSEYTKSKGPQSHIKETIYTNIPPIQNNISKPYTRRGEQRLCCRNNCHVRYHRWLIDNGSGFIDRKGFEFAIACGPTLARVEKSKHHLFYSAKDEGLIANVQQSGIQIVEASVCFQ
eukprot:TRINITY_DN3162_c1_g1_i1.p1 TRINITY_DN3162_c1_g1~~TRINITY_DN3162_c1_g1_i1.p1  ORF type:complete len:142 (-),score=34.61 TRINITY_DN3162_c1_g1_i1:98-523(-)